MDQYCLVVHKSRRPQARLQTAKLFCNNCDCSIVAKTLFSNAIDSAVNHLVDERHMCQLAR
jgi:hypothetical protein